MSSSVRAIQQQGIQQRRIEGVDQLARNVLVYPRRAVAAKRWAFSRASDTALNVGDGAWTRRGHTVKWASSQAGDITGLSTDGTYYVYAQLASGAGNDPRLIPDEVAVLLSEVSVRPTDDAGDLVEVLGEVIVSNNVIAGWTQYRHSDIDDVAVIPDGNSNSATTPVRKTLEWNPASGAHKDELQIRNCGNTPASQYRIPFFDGGVGGSLDTDLVVPDADLGGVLAGVQCSLTKRDTGTGKVLELYGFASPGSPTPGATDRVAVRAATGPALTWVDKTKFLAWLGTGRAFTQTWEGAACRGQTDAGAEWYLDSIVDNGAQVIFDMRQRCVKLSAQPGYCPYTGSVVALDPATGGEVALAIAAGVAGTYTGTIMGIDQDTGADVQLALVDGLVTTAYEGPIGVIASGTGNIVSLRVMDGGLFGS